MEVVQTISDARELRLTHHSEGRTVALVPTMGFLHEGHLSLVRRAHELAENVWVSIFVNPTQFGPGEDLGRYPQDLERDLELLEHEDVQTVFTPTVQEMYPEPAVIQVGFSGLERQLCGEDRPGHFAGVGLVVAKLFNIVEPDFAVFGQKDYQQALLIRSLARNLDFPVIIDVSPTVRETDGLAMSSRNALLSEKERAAVPVIYRSLIAGRKTILAGESDPTQVCKAVNDVLAEEPLVVPQYVRCVGARDLQQCETIINSDVVLAIAVRAGTTRLIDNIFVPRDASQE